MKTLKNKPIAANPQQWSSYRIFGLLQFSALTLVGGAFCGVISSAHAVQVPGYVPPVASTITPEYADDTRGVYVPPHEQYRLRTEAELADWTGNQYGQTLSSDQRLDNNQRRLNMLSNGTPSMAAEMNRIATDPGLMSGGQGTSDANMYAKEGAYALPQVASPQTLAQAAPPPNYMQAPAAPMAQQPSLAEIPASGYGYAGQVPVAPAPQHPVTTQDGGVEIAVGQQEVSAGTLDMHNSLVRLREERITVRRALQRMMDQIGGSAWSIVWDLDEQNAGLPDMEISLYAEEPFMNVMNALLARVQTRSGQPLRVIRYDQTRRLVITDRSGGYRLAGNTSSVGVEDSGSFAVTERVLKEAVVSLHFDEIPLVDALENIINQAGKGQWRLRMYAGMDQVLKPAHVEEPFNVAMERLLKLFNLKYEIFPGGKLIVVTHSNRFGFRGAGQR